MIWECLVPIVFGTDYLVKEKIEKQPDNLKKTYCKGHLVIRKLHNHGLAGGRLSQKPKRVLWITTAATALGCGYLFGSRNMQGSMERIGSSLLLGGALSNLSDRFRKGYVVDYLHFPKAFGKIGKLVFNLSDFCILIGGILTAAGVFKD